MFVAQSAQTIDREYVAGLGEEVFDTQTRRTYIGDGYTKVKFLPPLDTGTGPPIVIASDVEYNNAGSGLAAENVQAAIDETYQYANSVDLELNAHLVDTTAHVADNISYNPALAGGVASNNVQGAIDQHLLDTTAHSATNIPFAPTPTIVSSNVQAAITEIDAEIQNILAGGVVEASDISFVPTAPLSAVDVQDAIDQTAVIASYASSAASTANTNIDAHIADPLEAHTASAIKYVNSGVIADAFDVQDALDTLAAMIAAGSATPKYSTPVGDNSASVFIINHMLGTRNVLVQMFSNTTPFEQVEPAIERTDNNNVTLRFVAPPTLNQYTVVVG